MTNLEDALAAVAYGADAVGFIFAQGSPRFVPPQTVRKIVSALPPFVTTVGVFTFGEEKDFQMAIEECGIDLLQFHRAVSPSVIERYAHRAIQVVRVRDENTFDDVVFSPVRAYLFDSFHERVEGGSGVPFNWKIALQAKRVGKIILAGGLTPENVQEAIMTVSPYGVDVSSGVEAAPGKKDHGKLERFIKNAKEGISS